MQDTIDNYLEIRIANHTRAESIPMIALDSDLLEFEKTTTQAHIDTMRNAIDRGNSGYLITSEDLQNWHANLFTAGGYWRNSDVTISGSSHTPPAWRIVSGLMREFDRYLAHVLSSRQDPYIILAKIHLEFTRIHPFCDGNGRISRILLNYCAAYLRLSPIALSPYDRDYYLDILASEDIPALASLFRQSSVY